ncbi:MAG: putative baseplate assembly protein [Candidatus Methanoperedens sp.]|nr:putative baseplate assembly protein [Candidatus Methanoperedens sp.]
MLARLPFQYVPPDDPTGVRPLVALTTRVSDDPSIALLDAWATVADVLTFYQERIANEGYLCTATERRSILELARTIGYELKPGVSASTLIAFTVEEAPGAPGVAYVPKRTKVQSIPEQGQLPQTFETSVEITARAEWNTLRPRISRPQDLAIYSEEDKLYMLGISSGFILSDGAVLIPKVNFNQVYSLDPSTVFDLSNSDKPEEVQAIEVHQVYLSGAITTLKEGDILLLVGKNATAEVKTLIRHIRHIEVDAVQQKTRVDFEDKPNLPSFSVQPVEPASVTLEAMPFTGDIINTKIRKQTWRERDLSAFLSIQGWNGKTMLRHLNTSLPTRPSLLAPSPAVSKVAEGIFAFHVQLGFFGHNAPRYESLPGHIEARLKGNPYPHPWDGPSGWEIWKDPITNDYYSDAHVYLERSLQGVVNNSWVVFERPIKQYAVYNIESVTDASLTGFALSAKATGIELATLDGKRLEDNLIDKPDKFKVRKTTAYIQSERLELAQMPIEDSVAKGSTSLQLDRMVLGLQVDQPIILSGERNDLRNVTSNEIIFLSDISHSSGFTTIFFRDPLHYSYIRKTVTFNANVALATHGETVVEVLGSGDASMPNQRFTLKKPPLTYVSAALESGSLSTLQLRINGILWLEVPRLYGLDPRGENFIVQIDDDGRTNVIFGDGKMGSRLPTGTENVSAIYRSGIGIQGMVAADKLTLLQKRPLGIRSVTNPFPANGAAEAESLESARINAPMKVLAFDRIVSLQDFEDFARGFAGIGKAMAVALLRDGTNLVHITIAAAASLKEGDASSPATNVVDTESDLFEKMVKAIKKASDPAQKFQVDSYQPLFFNVKAKVLVDPRYSAPTVLAKVEDALIDAFSFGNRAFGQAVAEAEVMTVIQSIQGVIASDLDQLYRYEEDKLPPGLDEQIIQGFLKSGNARWDQESNRILMAQLLLINPVGIRLEEMKS